MGAMPVDTSAGRIARSTVRVSMAAALAVLLMAPAFAQTVSPTLAPTGTLRVSFLETNPVQGRVDATTGVVSGAVADIAAALARQLGVPYRIVPVENAAALIASIRSHATDVGLLAYDAARAVDVEFSDPYALMGNAYLVRSDSPIRRSADIDAPGITVGTVKGQSQQLYISEHLTRARIVMVPFTPPHAELVAMLTRGDINAFAANRVRMEEAAATSPAVRVLGDDFSVIGQALVVPKGDTAHRDLLSRFVAGIITSGLVQSSITRAGLTGVTVATAAAR